MTHVSLRALARERKGVWIKSIRCQVSLPRTEDSLLEALKLADLGKPGGVVYGLPAQVAANETSLNVRLIRRPLSREDSHTDLVKEDEWLLTWEQLTPKLADTVPPQVFAESEAFGGSVGLEELIRRHWASLRKDDAADDDGELLVTVDYALTGWRSKLLATKPKRFAQFRALPVESFWTIHDSDVLFGVSIRGKHEGVLNASGDEDLALLALSRVEADDPLDAANLETQVWREVSQLLEEIT